VVVVGAGISGLTAAYRLVRRDPSLEVTVLEADDRPGGKLRSVEVGGLSLPAGPDAFLARKPWAIELCRELGLGHDLVAPATSTAWLWTPRGLVPFPRGGAFGIPGDVGQVLRWPGVSRAGRRRALMDLVKRTRREGGDETLGSLLRRRLGDEVTDMAVGPLLAGLFAGDVDRLSVQATFPELQRWEATQGSLIRGAQATVRRAGDVPVEPMFLRPRAGTGRLATALMQELGPRVRTGAPAGSLRRAGGVWTVFGGRGEPVEADVVVVCTEAHVARHLLEPAAREAAAELEGIPTASTAVLLMVYGDGTAGPLPDGTGFVAPRGHTPMTAATFLSSKWPDPAFGTRAVVRCFVGAAGDEDVLDAADDDIVAACARHLAAVVPLPDRPEHAAVVRWPSSMPQYELGHIERVDRIRRNLPAGIFVTGQPYDGVGVPDCVRAAGETADAVLAHLAGRRTEEHIG
jgi:protoporphyrinogen/coproporphyrinogen III oxidase